MFWQHTKTSDVFNKHVLGYSNFDCQLKIRCGENENRSCLFKTPVPANRRMQATFNKTTGNYFKLSTSPAQDDFNTTLINLLPSIDRYMVLIKNAQITKMKNKFLPTILLL